jgi:integrase
MGQIRKRGATWWIRYYRNGQRFEESARTDHYETARDLLREKEGSIAKGAPVSPKIGRLRFEYAAKDLVTDYRINGKRSIAHVERHVKRLAKTFGGWRLSDITAADVRTYVEQRLKDGAANATINRELAALRRMYTLAVDAGTLIAKPKITMLQERNTRQGFFEHEQFRAVLRHLAAPLQAVATFAYWTGWRKSEILALEWSRVDRHAGIVRLDVGTTKNQDGREFHYGALVDVREMIDQQWAAHQALAKAGTLCPRVFHRQGKPIKNLQKAWRAACRAAGCPGRLLHDCRRTTVRNLERAGVSRSVAMQLTGHKTESVYRRYAIVSSGDLAEAARKLQTMTTSGNQSGQNTGTGTATGTFSGTIVGTAHTSDSAKASA